MGNALIPSSASLAERAAKAASAAAKNHRTVLIASGVFGALAHGFAFTNKLVNQDDIFYLFAKGGTVTLGRWGLSFMDWIFPNFSMPWIYGILTIAIISLVVCLLAELFDIRSNLSQVLLSGCIVVFPTLTGTFGYMFTSTSYAISFLLAVLAVWLLSREKPWLQLLALPIMVFSVSIYQAYIAVSASLLVLLLLNRLLQEEAVLPVIRQGLRYVAFLVLSLVIYYGLTLVVLRITGEQFGSYAQGGLSLRSAALLERVALAYSTYIRFFMQQYLGLVSTRFSRICHGVMLGCCLVLLLLWVFSGKRKSPGRLLTAAALLLIYPLAVNCMYLITPSSSIHTLVLYSFATIYLIPFILLNAVPAEASIKVRMRLMQCARSVFPAALAGIIIANTYIANEGYLNMHLRYENAYSLFTNLVSELHADPEFDEGTKIAVIGYYDPEFYWGNFYDAYQVTGVFGFVPDCYSYGRFLNYYIGVDIPLASSEEISQIRQTEEFQNMPRYPYYGSTAKFGDIYVVKIG